MPRHLTFTSVPLLLAAGAATQIPLATLTRTETAVTVNGSGAYTDLAVGAFRLGHPGRSAVLLRNGALELCFQPTFFRHHTTAGGTSLLAIATLPAGPAGRRDRLAALSAQGLHVQVLGSTGFADETAVHTAWAGMTRLKGYSLPYSGAPTPFMLGTSAGVVRVATLVAGAIAGIAHVPAPSGMTVLDAELLEWGGGGLPEVVALTSSGTFVIDLATLSVVQQLTSTTTTTGFLTPLPGAAALAQLTLQSGQWQVASLVPAGVAVASPLLTFAKPPIGIVGGRFDADGYADLIVSTGESTKHVLLGDASGPQTAAAQRIDFADTTAAADPLVDDQAPLVLDDADYDGELDAVLVNQANGTLTVVRELRRQIVGNVDPELLTSMADETTGLVLQGMLGYDWAFAPTEPSAWGAGNFDALGLRFDLPPNTPPTQSIFVTRYLVDDSSDDVDPTTGFTCAYGLSVGTGSAADVVALFDESLSTSDDPYCWWEGGQRYVLEYVLCETNGDGGFAWVGEPVFAMFGAKHTVDQDAGDLCDLFDLVEQEVGDEYWVKDHIGMNWQSMPLYTNWPDAPADNDNRWVGYHPIVRRRSATPGMPPAGTVRDMGNAKRW